MTPEFDPGGFLEGLSGQLQGLIPHDRVTVLYLDEGGRTVSVFAEHAPGDAPRRDDRYSLFPARASRYPIAEAVSPCVFAGQAEFVRDAQSDARCMAGTAVLGVDQAGLRAWMGLPLMGVERVIGALIVGNTVPDVYTETHLATGRQIADVIGPVIESIVLVHTERRLRQRLRVVPEVARVLGTSLNVAEIFHRLAAAVRPVLDFDIMATYLLESDGMKRWLLVAEGRPVRADERFEDFSFAARLLAREPVLMRECERELDLVNPTDRTILEDGIRSFIAVPLIFGEKVGGLLAFAKRQPDWFDLSDLEVVEEIAQHVVVAIQHQRLAEDQRRLAIAEGRAQELERPGQTSPCPPGARVPAGRRHRDAQGRLSPHRRHQPESHRRHGARPVPRGSVLPAQRVPYSPAAAARARRRRGAPRPGVRPPPGRADGQGGAGAEPRRPRAAGDVPVAR